MNDRRARQTIGILTSGGDCPGLNAAIRGVAKTALERYGMEVIGITNGYRGLIEGTARRLTSDDVTGILTRGGTILGTSREKPFVDDVHQMPLLAENFADTDDLGSARDSIVGRNKPQAIIDNYHNLGLDCLFILGGNGTQKTAHLLAERGLNVIGLPKTIDNDIYGTDVTFGFHSAVDIATEGIDRLHSTAHSHNRVMVIEVMGHRAGWLALYSGVAGGGDVILIPELPYRLDRIVAHLKRRAGQGKRFSIVVVAEGAVSENEAELSEEELRVRRAASGIMSTGYGVARRIEESCGMETRVTVLGYLQRGGTPCAYDRILSTQFGTAAVELFRSGHSGHMVALEEGHIVSRPLSEVAGRLKYVSPNHPLISSAKSVDTCFGDA